MAFYMTAQWKYPSGAEAKVEAALRLFVAALREDVEPVVLPSIV